MLETMVQAGSWLLRETEDFAYSTILLKDARALKFSSFVPPGQTLNVTVKIQDWNGPDCTMTGVGRVNDQISVRGRFTLERFNLRDRNPALAEHDADQIRELRSLFAQIWNPSQKTSRREPAAAPASANV